MPGRTRLPGFLKGRIGIEKGLVDEWRHAWEPANALPVPLLMFRMEWDGSRDSPKGTTSQGSKIALIGKGETVRSPVASDRCGGLKAAEVFSRHLRNGGIAKIRFQASSGRGMEDRMNDPDALLSLAAVLSETPLGFPASPAFLDEGFFRTSAASDVIF